MENDFELYGKIVCAALLHNNCIYMSRKGHFDIFTMEPIGVLRNSLQGFATENGFFVDRKTALEIAQYFNQIELKHKPNDKLMSEDLKKNEDILVKQLKYYTYKSK